MIEQLISKEIGMRPYVQLNSSANGGDNICLVCYGKGYITRLEKHEMIDGIKNPIISNDYCYMCNGSGILHATGNETGFQV